MKITVIRHSAKPTYTIGRLYVDGTYICDTLEDTDRGLSDNMTEEDILRRKVKHQTAIPTGIYNVDLDTPSSSIGSGKFYKDVCQGKLPRLQRVKGFQGILIHCGNTPSDTSGCILVGQNKVVGKVVNSQRAFRRLYDAIKGDKYLKIDIQRMYKI